MVEAFEGNKAETKTMISTLKSFMATHQLADITVVAEAGMVSEANQNAIEDAGLTFIIGAKIPEIPYQVKKWHTLTSRSLTGTCSPRRSQVGKHRGCVHDQPGR
jgi:transposase